MSVLVIVVDPPGQGDPVHTLEKQFDKYAAGDIFVRRKGGTHKANPAEVRALVARATRHDEEALAVQVCGTASVRALDWTADGLADWMHDEEVTLLAPLQEEEQARAMRRWSEQDPVNRVLSGGAFANVNQFANLARSAGDPYRRPEGRTPEKFRQQVQTYLDEAAGAGIERAIREHVRLGLCDIGLRLENPGVVPFRSVSVKLFIPGEGVAAYDGPPPASNLPSRPRNWGHYNALLHPSHAVLHPSVTKFDPPDFGPAIDIDNSGSAAVAFPPIDLGPEDQRDLPVFSLLVPADMAGTSIDANWEARSAYTRGVPRGTSQSTFRMHLVSRAESGQDIHYRGCHYYAAC